MMWFSAVYADPEQVELPYQAHPSTLHRILWHARKQAFGDGRDQYTWSTSQLIAACKAQGLRVRGQEETREYWVIGKRSVGLKGFLPVWERMYPPKLTMLEQIRKKSLDELEDLMNGLSQDTAVGDDDLSTVSDEATGMAAVGSDEHGRGQPHSTGSREGGLDGSVATSTGSSGSVFVPSGSEEVGVGD
jgi:hypothetical protein